MKRLILCFVCLSLLAVAGIASACGGFFCTNTPVDQSAERIIFTINNDDTISAIVGIDYEGAAEDFSWVVPVPSIPELDVAPTSALDVLQNATNPQINPPRNYCHGVLWSEGGFGGGGGGYLEEGNLGPYDYAIISSDDPRELINWLRDNGYRVTEDMEPIIADYVFDGMYFVAMKLSNDSEVGDIQPVKMTYKSENPMIPIKLTAVAALDNMPVLVWIFANTPYSPDNYAHPDVNFAGFRTDSQLKTPWRFSDTTNDYLAERNRIQRDYDGQAFITEYAMPSLNLLEINESVVDESYLMDLINDYPFVTRLRAQLSPDQMTLDPSFIPDTQQNHVPRTVELEDYLDPLHYWGCSTREFDTTESEQLLLNSVILPNDVPFRYPNGWIQSNVTYRDVHFIAFAPEAVTEKHLDTFFFDGEVNFMMVLFMVNTPNRPYYNLGDIFDFEEDYRRPDNVSVQMLLYHDLFTNFDYPRGVFVMLSTMDEWEGNRSIYNAMSDHFRSYTYYAHPQLRNTLALSEVPEDYSGDAMMLGFPEGWTEFSQNNEMGFLEVVISPDDGSSGRIEVLRSSAYDGIVRDYETGLDELRDVYGLTDEAIDAMRTFNENNCTVTGVAQFEADGRIGYLQAIDDWIVVASVLPQDFEANQDILRQVAESLTNPYPCVLG